MSTLTTVDVAALIEQARVAMDEFRFEEASALAQQALDQAADKDQSASAEFIVCIASYRLGRFQIIAVNGDAVLHKLECLGREQDLFTLLRFMSIACSQTNEIVRALGFADRSERLALKLGAGDGPIMLARSAMAACYFSMGNPWRAELLLLNALGLPTAKQLRMEAAIALLNLGAAQVQIFHLLRDAGDEQGAQKSLQRALHSHQECLAIGSALNLTYIMHA